MYMYMYMYMCLCGLVCVQPFLLWYMCQWLCINIAVFGTCCWPYVCNMHTTIASLGHFQAGYHMQGDKSKGCLGCTQLGLLWTSLAATDKALRSKNTLEEAPVQFKTRMLRREGVMSEANVAAVKDTLRSCWKDVFCRKQDADQSAIRKQRAAGS